MQALKVIIKSIVLMFCFLLTQSNVVCAKRLYPQDFDAMYKMADDGDLISIKYAMARGLDIDAKNKYGNTGICEAILNGDYRAYNTFYAAGANPQPPCVFMMPKSIYAKFMKSSFVTPIRSTRGFEYDDVSVNWLNVPENEAEAQYQESLRIEREKEQDGFFSYWLKSLNPFNWF